MKKIAFLFPGQGSQYVGMGKSLCDTYAAARETFEEANEALGFDLRKLCFEGSLEELTKTENTQPALLTCSVAAFRVYMKESGMQPAFLAGHSLGEFSALTCSDAIKFSDAVKIVRQRGRFMQEAVPIGVGSMAAVSGADRAVIEEECSKCGTDGRIVVVSNYNSPEQIVISGHMEAVAQVSENLKVKGARVIPLKVSAPFHSPLMQPAAECLKEEMKKYAYSEPKYPVISNVTALPYTGSDKLVETLSLQIVKPVRWQESIEYIKQQGVETAVEMGPKTVLKNLMKKNAPDIITYSYDTYEDVKTFMEKVPAEHKPEVSGSPSKLKLLIRCMGVAVCTKNRNWDNNEYQKGVVEPYRKIQNMVEELERDNKEPSVEQMKEGLEMLRSVFITKGTPLKEQKDRFNQIFDETGLGELFADFRMPE
jgi:[acyl-carrier-protein] S-malonyltransferase